MSAKPSLRPELRRDPVMGRWVIVSPARAKRPSEFKSKSPSPGPTLPYSDTCPFCSGNEHLCAPEIFRVPPEPGEGWKVRVIENLYPALDRNCKSDGEGGGEDGAVLPGFGFHDVVIETPVHSVNLSGMSGSEIGAVIGAWTRRVLDISSSHEIKYVQVFKNHGASAGASLSHSHSQIIALPVVPSDVAARIHSMKENFGRTGRCCLCNHPDKELVVSESAHFISYVPFAATHPFEIWIVPRDHSPHFHELDNDKAADLGSLLKLMLRKLAVQLNDPPFNFMIQTSPLQNTASLSPYCHWFLQIIPQLTIVGGFEVATGCYINPVFSEDAAKVLRDVDILNF
ncbi:hypothetical protein MLD38_030936 [Melastoma candidum]|uniref:Uncharacterized protein n=1 Tax=Melastoma candidum TaxID=119954 RepID=A0ACB9MN69_9MYRT|nr:hypothetical protein MLD38_030936 [Melastoma candidum]